ncbi:MAG: hypothetical protein WCT05_03400 [Lentisphaeria bacterium]
MPVVEENRYDPVLKARADVQGLREVGQERIAMKKKQLVRQPEPNRVQAGKVFHPSRQLQPKGVAIKMTYPDFMGVAAETGLIVESVHIREVCLHGRVLPEVLPVEAWAVL